MSAPPEACRRPAPCGLLIVDKPTGPTSHDVVDRARRALRLRRIGHTGTLDPLASGVLVLLLGAATRLSGLLAGHPKSYTGEALLGQATDTYDRTGRPLGEAVDGANVDLDRLQAAAATLTGELQQAPPPFSARKVNGVPLHRRARRGETVQGRPVRVRVARLEVSAPVGGRFRFAAQVSAGTYIRSLIHDLGQALGCGAHLLDLRREAAGPFHTSRALPLADLERDPAATLAGPSFVPLDDIPLDLPRVVVDREGLADLAHGRPFRGRSISGAPPAAFPPAPSPGLVQVRDGADRLLALALPGPAPDIYRPRTVLPRRRPVPSFTPAQPGGSVGRIKSGER